MARLTIWVLLLNTSSLSFLFVSSSRSVDKQASLTCCKFVSLVLWWGKYYKGPYLKRIDIKCWKKAQFALFSLVNLTTSRVQAVAVLLPFYEIIRVKATKTIHKIVTKPAIESRIKYIINAWKCHMWNWLSKLQFGSAIHMLSSMTKFEHCIIILMVKSLSRVTNNQHYVNS